MNYHIDKYEKEMDFSLKEENIIKQKGLLYQDVFFKNGNSYDIFYIMHKNIARKAKLIDDQIKFKFKANSGKVCEIQTAYYRPTGETIVVGIDVETCVKKEKNNEN